MRGVSSGVSLLRHRSGASAPVPASLLRLRAAAGGRRCGRLAQRGAPVRLGAGLPWVGIGALLRRCRVEPGACVACWAAGGGVLALLDPRYWRAGCAARPVPLALALVAGGAVPGRAARALGRAPVLDWRYYGPVDGARHRGHRPSRVRRAAADAGSGDPLPRGPRAHPRRVRVSLHGAHGFTPPPGAAGHDDRAPVTPAIRPPAARSSPAASTSAAMPGSGGWARSATPACRWCAWARRRRAALACLSARMALSPAPCRRAARPGQGGFAAAITTGDRSGEIGAAELQALRDTNLAHLLAISGLHMGL